MTFHSPFQLRLQGHPVFWTFFRKSRYCAIARSRASEGSWIWLAVGGNAVSDPLENKARDSLDLKSIVLRDCAFSIQIYVNGTQF